MTENFIRNSISKVSDFLLEFFIPPKCPVCGKLLDISDGDDGVLCEDCFEKWNEEREKTCKKCLKIAAFCNCTAKLNKTGLISYYSSCIMYESEFSKKFIVALKYKSQKKLIEFTARQLMNNIYVMYDVDFSNCVIAYPPRSRSSLKKYGFDHAKMIAEALGEKTKIPVFHGISNKGSKEQKYLSYEGRAKNAFESFYIKNKTEANEFLKGKTVILIDDVTTTGATAVCISAFLHNCGVESVKFFTAAKTPPPSKNM